MGVIRVFLTNASAHGVRGADPGTGAHLVTILGVSDILTTKKNDPYIRLDLRTEDSTVEDDKGRKWPHYLTICTEELARENLGRANALTAEWKGLLVALGRPKDQVEAIMGAEAPINTDRWVNQVVAMWYERANEEARAISKNNPKAACRNQGFPVVRWLPSRDEYEEIRRGDFVPALRNSPLLGTDVQGNPTVEGPAAAGGSTGSRVPIPRGPENVPTQAVRPGRNVQNGSGHTEAQPVATGDAVESIL